MKSHSSKGYTDEGFDGETSRKGDIAKQSALRYDVLRQYGREECAVSKCSVEGCASRSCSLARGLSLNKNSSLLIPPKLLFPVSSQVRYVDERTVEVFTANATGRIELHNILHPNMSGNMVPKVHSMSLTDGKPCHRVTCRDVVDRTPFSVHGTFDGTIGIAKSSCTPEMNKVTMVKIWRGKDPVMVTKVSQLDNALLAATNYQYVLAKSSLFVLDIASQSKLGLQPRQVFNVTYPTMLDVCWLWDHPARLLLSTTDSIRLFDIRCPNRTEQALFLNHNITHMASNMYRTHVFATFSDNGLHIYDSRQLFGPIQHFKVPMERCSGLNCMRWNPYMPYELLLHFRGSSRVLRCRAPELSFDLFRKSSCYGFKSEDIFCMEQIWEGSLSSDVIESRLEIYKDVSGSYTLGSYGEMFDKCKEDPESPMPLCWMAPTEKVCHKEMVFIRERCKSFTQCANVSFPRPLIFRRVCSDSHLSGKHPKSETFATTSSSSYLSRILHENTITKLVRSRSQDSFKEKDVVHEYAINSTPDDHSAYESVPHCRRYSSAMADVGINKVEDTDFEKEVKNITEKCKDNLLSVFQRLGLDLDNLSQLAGLQKQVEVAVNDEESEPLHVISALVENGKRKNKVDNGHRIELLNKILSFDFAPVGYSGILCLVEQRNGRPKLVFAPFVAPDEGSAVISEYAKVLEEIRVWESSDTVPFHLYQTMKLRLYNGMDNIDNHTPLLSILQNMAAQIPKKWMQWLLNSARRRNDYCGRTEVSGDSDMIAGDDRFLIAKNTPAKYDEGNPLLSMNVKGLPGILQLITLESESDVIWRSCDSNHFTYIKIARSPIRRLITTSFCLPVNEEWVVSDERFAASKDVLKQIPVIFLCLINGDSVRFIEYTLFIRRKLGKPMFTDDPCSFLNAFYFFSTVVFRYVNKISGAANKSSPKYVARRLRLVDKIYAFIKQQSDSSSLNPFFIPMLLFLHGEMTYTHPEKFTKIVLENERIPLSLRIAWSVNLLCSAKLREALHFLFRKSSGMNRLQFVGLGRHPDSLTVLSEYLYTTQDCQVFSHLLVAGRCFEDDVVTEMTKSEDSPDLNFYEIRSKNQCAVSVPSLVTMFPTTYLNVTNDMSDLLHLARAEFCRYSFLLQRMEKYCFRRKLLNLVPQIYWPYFKASVDISCTFCGSSHEVALRNAESALSDHLSQVRSRMNVNRTVASRSSISLATTSMSVSFSSVGPPSDSDANAFASASATSTAECYSYDYNGVDGGTEAEIKRPPDSACPQCRKSYPRCCLCGLSYGIPVNDYDHPAGSFPMMFSTCLMCSHGGHTKHVISWFEKEDECPVTGCDCRCLYLEDGIGGRIRQTILAPF